MQTLHRWGRYTLPDVLGSASLHLPFMCNASSPLGMFAW